MTAGNINAVADWLIDGARSAAESHTVLEEMCERLVRCGIPLWRVSVFVRTLHPQIMGRRFTWRPGVGIEVRESPHEMLASADFRESPVRQVYDTVKPIRRRLADAGCPVDFPILRDLHAESVTDYLALPLRFTNGEIHVATWTTREPGGFTEAQIAGIEAIAVPLARVAEVRALRRTAANLLNTYVGNNAGERILAGQIRRGDTQAIHAVIWLSDMRGFTKFADRLPPQTLIDLLNRYFDCQVPVIQDCGGEVLKFMGDGLLAIFRISQDNEDLARICAGVLAAARQVRTNVAAADMTMLVGNTDAVRFGLALHVGEILYGNIGSGNRLDFTCIGPAVNLAARIEKLAGSLGRTLVLSNEFAQHCRPELMPLGEFALPGFRSAQAVFGLADEIGTAVAAGES
jgi:adenylate cyclase